MPACQSDWSRCYTYGTNIVWDFQIVERRTRETHCMENHPDRIPHRILEKTTN